MIRSYSPENRTTLIENTSAAQSVNIRRARPGDELEILRLYTAGVPEGLANTTDNAMDMRAPQAVYFDNDAVGRLWVAEARAGSNSRDAPGAGHLVAMLGVIHDHAGVAVIRRLRVQRHWRGGGLIGLLLKPLLAYCRERSYLKIIFDLDIQIDPQPLLHIFEREGLHHSRHRSDPTRELIEFYVDLYQASVTSSDLLVGGSAASGRRGPP